LHTCKIFHWFFALNIFTWNLVGCCKTPSETCSVIFRRFVGQLRVHLHFNFQSCSYPKKVHLFQLLSQSDGHNWDLLCRNVISNVFSLCFTAFWIRTTKFFGNMKNTNHVTMTSHVRVTYLKIWVAVFRIRRYLHWLNSAIWSRVMADHNFKSLDRGFCGLGLKLLNCQNQVCFLYSNIISASQRFEFLRFRVHNVCCK